MAFKEKYLAKKSFYFPVDYKIGNGDAQRWFDRYIFIILIYSFYTWVLFV